MRIHGIHLQGLRSPHGENRLELDPGYNVIVAGQAADGLATLFRALLSPAVPFTVPSGWLDPDARLAARIGLSLSVGADFYQLFADLRAGRVAIGKLDPRDRSFARVGKTSVETAGLLRTLGLPDSEVFLLLHTAFGDFADDVAEPGSPRPAAESDAETERVAAEPHARASGAPATVGPLPDPRDREASDRQAAGRESAEAAALAHEAEQRAHEERLAADRERRTSRRAELAARGDRLARVQRELELAKEAIAERQILAELLDDFDSLALHYKAQLEIRQRELASVERARRALLDERIQLRGVPRSRQASLWLGLILGVSGVAAGWELGAAFYAIGVFGGVLAGVVQILARQAKRRLGKVEAKLSALRVRERSVEQSFESETEDVRAVLGTLGLETIDELYREVADYRGLLARAERLDSDRREAEQTFTSEDQEELARLEEALESESDPSLATRGIRGPIGDGARSDGEPGPADLAPAAPQDRDAEDDEEPVVVELPPLSSDADRGEAADEGAGARPVWGEDTTQPQEAIDLLPLPRSGLRQTSEPRSSEPRSSEPRSAFVLPKVSRRAAPRPDPDTLVRAAEQASGHPASEIRDRLAPSLPLYLRALSGGRFSQVRRRDDFAWVVRRDDHDKFRAVRELDPEDFARFGVAVRLAILEGLAPGLRTPLLVGPGLPYSDPQGRMVLARALRRLSSAVQVVQIAPEGGDWVAQAARVHQLDT